MMPRYQVLARRIQQELVDPERVRPLVTGLPALWNQLQQDLGVFVSFLDGLGR